MVRCNDTFKWGLAGYGSLAQQRLVDALNQPPNKLSVVWGRSIARAKAFAEQFGIPKAARSLNELTEDVDAIYVAVPPVAHLPVAMIAVQARRHVLIEKPLSPTFTGYQQLLFLIAETGVKAAVSYYRRFAPIVHRLRHILTAGELGSVRFVQLNFASPFHPKEDDPKAWRLNATVAGGGVSADAGSHRLDLLCWLLGNAQVVDARILSRTARAVDRVAEMTLLFSSGVRAQCRFSWDDIKLDRIVFCGDAGTATLDRGQLIVETAEGTRFFNDAPPANLHGEVVQSFRRWVVLGSEEPLCTLSEAHDVDLLLETAYGFGGNAEDHADDGK